MILRLPRRIFTDKRLYKRLRKRLPSVSIPYWRPTSCFRRSIAVGSGKEVGGGRRLSPGPEKVACVGPLTTDENGANH
jgi:hypothetical protein